MKYNTEVTPLKLPKYGRSIQNMVDHALTITDREERIRCAQTIVHVMSSQTQSVAEAWNNLAIMADFKLDIDYPCELVPLEELKRKPAQVNYSTSDFSLRVYGQYIPTLLRITADLPDTADKAYTIFLIACNMKRCHVFYNGGLVEDGLIFSDIAYLTDGRIDIPPSAMTLPNPQTGSIGSANSGQMKRKNNNSNRNGNQNRQVGQGQNRKGKPNNNSSNNNRNRDGKKFRNA